MGEDVVDERLHATDARTEGHAYARSELRRHLEVRVGECLSGDRDRELRETVRAPNLFAIHVLEGIEVLDLAGDRRFEAGRIEARYRADAALAREDAIPRLLHRGSEGADHADAGNDDPAPRAVSHGSSVLAVLERLQCGDLRRFDQRGSREEHERDRDKG